MSLSQGPSAGMPRSYQIYHPAERASLKGPPLEITIFRKVGAQSGNVMGKVQTRRLRAAKRDRTSAMPLRYPFRVILSDKTWQHSPLTLYMTMFIHLTLTGTSNRWQTCKPSNLKYADATRGLINTDHFSSALSGFLLCLN